MATDLEKTIIEVLTDTEFYAGKEHYIKTVVEEQEPFFWRINKKWAEETAKEIVKNYENRLRR